MPSLPRNLLGKSLLGATLALAGYWIMYAYGQRPEAHQFEGTPAARAMHPDEPRLS